MTVRGSHAHPELVIHSKEEVPALEALAKVYLRSDDIKTYTGFQLECGIVEKVHTDFTAKAMS